ncbi:MAG: RnfABCDGE type electron transport complex subunit A [Candidatus Altiarchaeales archaeon]|nr:RnfABCDGE type electron transport complex subunit A [Candidatus Altiarchaeales archaeon]
MDLFLLFLSAAVINNFIFYRFLGLCPFIGVSKKTSSALGMGAAVTLVMLVTSLITWPLYTYVLEPASLGFMRIIAFILVISTLVQLIEIVLRKINPSLYEAFGIYLPLITTNCAILGLALLNILKEHSYLESIVFGAGAGAGFTMALLIMSGIRERLELSDVPPAFQGVPIAFIVAGLLALAFSGFGGIT